MSTSYKHVALLVFVVVSLVSSSAHAGHPACHIMICCRENNAGSTFLVNGQWNPNHQYNDIETVRDVLQKIKDAGIRTVFVDMTNASQWGEFWDKEKISLSNIHQVCQEKGMQWAMHIGNAAASLGFWSGVAKTVWDTWAQTPTYRNYGYGDDRPILIMFMTHSYYTGEYNKLSAQDRANLDRFHIGTIVGNGPEPFNASDGWGYRQTFQNTSGSVRFGAPTNGFAPTDPWTRISGAEWKDRVRWIKEASEYSIYGSYDDMCDAISFGIANTDNTTTSWNIYPNRDPYVYYNAVKEALTQVARQPYGNAPAVIPGTIQAEAYDVGGESVAYHDADSGNNKGNVFRSDDVDIENAAPSGANVASIVDGEWLEYTVNVRQAGTYTATISVASLDSTSSLSIAFDGQDKTGTLTHAATGGWQVWQTVNTRVVLSQGTQVMRVNFSGSGFNLDKISFSLLPGTVPPMELDAGSGVDGGSGSAVGKDAAVGDAGRHTPDTTFDKDASADAHVASERNADSGTRTPNIQHSRATDGCGCSTLASRPRPVHAWLAAVCALLVLYRIGKRRLAAR